MLLELLSVVVVVVVTLSVVMESADLTTDVVATDDSVSVVVVSWKYNN